MQSNPIQQRIELICDKWEDAKQHKSARIVRIQCQPGEEDMVDTFYTYMIGVDTPILDIAFHFDSQCTDLKLFSTQLLKELQEIMHIWDHVQQDGKVDYTPVKWKADFSLQKDKNPAAMFVHNFNRLAKAMEMGESYVAVAILRGAVANKELATWLKYAMEVMISPLVKFLIHDTVAKPLFQSMALSAPSEVVTIPLNLDMPKAMEQIAAIGDPNDPSTPYRKVFAKMFNALEAGKEVEAEKYGHECIKIATDNISNDPYWITQVVVVCVALGNDKIRYKKKKETLAYANQAVEAATTAQTYFENGIASMLLGQTLMFRGTVYFVQDNFTNAFPDFNIAFEIYQKQGNMHLAIEACRMAGQSALKDSQKRAGIELLVTGARLGKKIDKETALGSTYRMLLDLLLQTNHTPYMEMNEIDEMARRLYGPDWVSIVKDWKHVPDAETLQRQQMASA